MLFHEEVLFPNQLKILRDIEIENDDNFVKIGVDHSVLPQTPCPRDARVRKKYGPIGGCPLDKGFSWTRIPL